MITFINRNLKMFFRDKTAVFFSLLAVFIVLGLYIVFLGDVWVDSFKEIKGEKVASAASDSTSEILINGLSTGKVEVIATSVVDKTKKASYILYVNDEFLTPKEIQIDISDAISRSVMDAEGNAIGIIKTMADIEAQKNDTYTI